MLEGIKIKPLTKRPDERGFFTELIRKDWKELLQEDSIAQANLSISYPNIIRAWHRHLKGQVDYFIVLKGAVKIGNENAWLLYFVNRLYDYSKPDEERRPWNDPTIIPEKINGRKDDPRVGKPWDWNYPPHK